MSEELILSLISKYKDGNESSLLELRNVLKGLIYRRRPYNISQEDAFDTSLIHLQ